MTDKEVPLRGAPLHVVLGSFVLAALFRARCLLLVDDPAMDLVGQLAAAGDVLAMRPLISHASGTSLEGTHRHRRILHLEFAAAHTILDGYEWHDFIQPTCKREPRLWWAEHD